MPLLVTSAAGANGDGYGALLAFDLDGRPLGTFSDDSCIADPRGLAVDRARRGGRACHAARVKGPNVVAVQAEHARKMERASDALYRQAANRLREIRMKSRSNPQHTGSAPTMPQPQLFTIGSVVKTLKGLKALSIEEQAKLLLRRFVEINPQMGSGGFSKHNLSLPGDSYRVAAGFLLVSIDRGGEDGMTSLHCIKRIPPAPYLCKTFDFGSHREVGRMFLIHEPEQAFHGPQRSTFFFRLDSRHCRCILEHSLPLDTT
jgi:hypothetical protein